MRRASFPPSRARFTTLQEDRTLWLAGVTAAGSDRESATGHWSPVCSVEQSPCPMESGSDPPANVRRIKLRMVNHGSLTADRLRPPDTARLGRGTQERRP